MTQKMKEMDDVIRKVHSASLQDNLERTLLVCDSFFFSTSSLLSLVTYMYVTKKSLFQHLQEIALRIHWKRWIYIVNSYTCLQYAWWSLSLCLTCSDFIELPHVEFNKPKSCICSTFWFSLYTFGYINILPKIVHPTNFLILEFQGNVPQYVCILFIKYFSSIKHIPLPHPINFWFLCSFLSGCG